MFFVVRQKVVHQKEEAPVSKKQRVATSFFPSTWALVITVFLLAGSALATDWPQWRGPERNGRSAETGLLGSWSEGGPPLAWRAKGMGHGYSSLAVVGDVIYTTGDIGETQYVIAAKRNDGSALWKTAIGPAWDDEYLGARSTPTIDGDRLYAISTEGDLVCLEAATGREHWRRSLAKDFGASLMQAMGQYSWKFAESPLVDGDRVVVTPGTAEAALVALDKKTGKELWRAKMPELGPKGRDGAGYSSAIVADAAGKRQYVQLLGRGVIGVEADSGRFLWGYNRVANEVANIPTPIVDGDRLFVSTGYQTGAALLELQAKDGGVEAREAYFLESDTMQNHHGGSILHNGYIYTGTGHNKGFPLSLALQSGKVAWGPIRNDGKGSAAVIYADDRLYFRYQNGLMVLIEASPEAYREMGSFQIPDVEQFSWSHPAISDGRLYLREQDNLFCYDIAEKKAPEKTSTTTR